MKLREWRKKQKLKLAELANKLKMNESTLSRYETGAIEPSFGAAKKIDRFTNRKVDPRSFYKDE